MAQRAPRFPSLAALLGAAALTAAAGCGSGNQSGTDAGADTMLFSCVTETRAVPYTPGMERTSTSGAYLGRLLSSAMNPPGKGIDTWSVQIVDSSAAPVDGLTVKAVPFMPDHNHGTSKKAVVTPEGEGRYTVTPVYFFMAGYWEVELTFQLAGGAPDAVMFPICIPG